MAKPKNFANLDKPLPQFDPVRERITHPVDIARVKVGEHMRLSLSFVVKEVHNDNLVIEDLEHGDTLEIPVSLFKGLKSASQITQELPVSLSDMVRIMTSTYHQPFTVAYVKKDGQERVAISDYLGEDHLFGRSLINDRELPKDDQIRLVDHRTLMWLITGGVRYRIR